MLSQYHFTRSGNEGMYCDAVREVYRSSKYLDLAVRAEKINEKRIEDAKHYICTYAIHPDDEEEVLSQERKPYRRCYSDTMNRKKYFIGTVLCKEGQEPFPMPGIPVDVMISSPHPSMELKIPKFADFRCMNCYEEPDLPSGYYCKKCTSKERMDDLTKDDIVRTILKRLEQIVEAAEVTDFEASIRSEISVATLICSTYDGSSRKDCFQDIRLILTAKRDITDVISNICRNFT